MESSRSKPYYGWVVVASFLLAGTIIFGIRFSFGVFFKSISTEFDLGRAATSSIFSAHMIFGTGFVIMGGWALDRFGPRRVLAAMGLFTGLSLLLTSAARSTWQLYITYSLLLAVGGSAMYIVAMSTVSRWFDRRRGLAIGITVSSSSLGSVVIAPLAALLVAGSSWRTAYLVLGLIAWVTVIPLAGLLKRNAPGRQPVPVGAAQVAGAATGLSLPEALVRRSFWLIISGWLLYGAAKLLVMTHIVPHALDMGLGTGEAAAILSVLGVAGIAGSVLGGIIADRIGNKLASVIFALLQSGALFWLMRAGDVGSLYIFAVAFGFVNGGYIPSMSAVISQTFGLRHLGAVGGVLEVGGAIGSAIGPLVGGIIFDMTTSYSLAFLAGALSMLVLAGVMGLVRREVAI